MSKETHWDRHWKDGYEEGYKQGNYDQEKLVAQIELLKARLRIEE